MFKSKSIVFTLIFSLTFLMVEWLFLSATGLHDDHEVFYSAAVMSRFHIDFFVFCGLGVLFLDDRLWLRYITHLLLAGFFAVYLTQFLSLQLAGSFLPVVAIENAAHIGFIAKESVIVTIVIGLLCFIALFFLLEKTLESRNTSYKRVYLAVVLFACALVLKLDDLWLPDDWLRNRADVYSSGKYYINANSPTYELLRVFRRAYYRQLEEDITGDGTSLVPELLQTSREYGLAWAETDASYPLIKNEIYSSPLSFTKKSETGRAHNVILFLTEGMSARTIQPYSDLFPGISPNLQDFSSYSMRVDDYYNHTFSTYRGLQGSLCSLYPAIGSGQYFPDTKYRCLHNVLKDEGFETHFFISQSVSGTNLSKFLERLDFDKVHNLESLNEDFRKYKPDEKMNRRYLTDRQFIDAFIINLRKKESDDKPFFMGLYNLQTHGHFKLRTDGVRYKKETEDGDYILNTIYNFDNVFGKFWSYFKQSPFFENTVVIFTADHAHNPDADYRQMMKQDIRYQPVFMDRIPMMIYHPNLNLPGKFDAKGRTSLSLAPTLLHLLDAKNQPNAFVGRSLFDATVSSKHIDVAMADNVFIFRDDKGNFITRAAALKEDRNWPERNNLYKILRHTHLLEKNNLIWK